MSAFYNEIDPFAAQWLRNLIAAQHINVGVVNERSVSDLTPADVHGVTQAHFFAGIGCWSHALRLADWPDDRSIWTGSCPCQPFSAAGKGEGFTDPRHLWPDWFKLIKAERPPVIMGEQVASRAGLAWLDVVQTDLENASYTVRAADTCAAGVGAPHIRQRLYFMAYATEQGRGSWGSGQAGDGRDAPWIESRRLRDAGGMAHTDAAGLGLKRSGGLLDGERQTHRNDVDGRGADGLMSNLWSNAEWIQCQDGKSRPVEPGSFPLAHGTAARVGRLRAYGNAIVAQQAAAFIRAARQEIDEYADVEV